MYRKHYQNRSYRSRSQFKRFWSSGLGAAAIVVLYGMSALMNARTKAFKIYPTSEPEGRAALEYVNQFRRQYGKQPIAFDQRAYTLAVARAWDMRKYKYYDHMNLKTGDCADTMKVLYGFAPSEFVAENINGYLDYSEDFFTIKQMSPIKGVVDAWLNSRGHRYNLLYGKHTAGAIGCYKDKCVFLGVNNQRFGQGCHTAAEGKKSWQGKPQQPGEV